MDFYDYPHTNLNQQNQNWLIQQMNQLIEDYANYKNPAVVTYANQMVDHNIIYIYQGNEIGMNTTHWYFWYNDTWNDGGKWGTVDVTDEELQAAVNTWLNAHPEATTTVQDGSITVAKFAPGVIDPTLTQSGKAADAKATGDAVNDAKSELTGNTAYNPPMIQGGTSSADGSLAVRTDRICTEIKYPVADVVSVSIGSNYQFLLAQFNGDEFIGNTSWIRSIAKSSIRGTNFRVTVKSNSGGNILPAETTGLTINLDPQSTTELLIKLYDEREIAKADDATLKSQIDQLRSVISADAVGFNQIARLGWKPYAGYYPPEQSLASYKLAYQMGMRLLLADVRKTSDNTLVCFHDASINSTARNSDGTTISETINIADHTLAELNAYDYGIYKGYPNEGILTLDAFLKLCGQINCIPILETKIWLTVEEVNSIVTMVRKYGLQDGFIWAEMPETTIATRTCTIIRQKLPNATIMIRGGSYSTDALPSAIAFAGADKKTILSFTDYSYITSNTVATCRENNIDIEYSLIQTTAEMDTLYANAAFSDIRYIVCSEFNLHDYLMDKLGISV